MQQTICDRCGKKVFTGDYSLRSEVFIYPEEKYSDVLGNEIYVHGGKHDLCAECTEHLARLIDGD